jgi:hypothetical protein
MKRILPIVHVVAACVVTVMLSGFAAKPQELQTKAVDDPEAYSVYASLLPAEWRFRVAHAKTLVFQQETGTNWKCMPSGKPLETDWKLVVDTFREENAGTRLLRTGFSLGIPYLAIPAAEIQASFHDVPNDPMLGWTGFYKRYPDSGGYIVVSAVGFDPVKRRAMVYMAHSCGSLCGGGTHHLLEKVDGAWREAKIPGVSNCVWVS